MKTIDRIEAVGEKTADTEYREQKDTDSYTMLCDLRRDVTEMKSDMSEKTSEVNYLMAETEALKAMVRELANIIDERTSPAIPTKGFE